MSKPNNPPAFPKAGLDHWNKSTPINEGMTLRDYFAAKAMQAAITGCATRGEVGLYSNWANLAYDMADAMLIAREA
jgi:hypothetical protein